MSHLFHATNGQADSYLTSKQRKKRNVMTHLSGVAEIQHEHVMRLILIIHNINIQKITSKIFNFTSFVIYSLNNCLLLWKGSLPKICQLFCTVPFKKHSFKDFVHLDVSVDWLFLLYSFHYTAH